MSEARSLSHYQLHERIGAGGMGEVWRARDGRLDREVAVKILPEDFANDEERLRRFEREAKALAQLNHPNVAQIFGVDQVDDTCFLVLELVRGESLAERLARGPLPLDEALDVGRQIAEGLEAAHEAGIVHRDLKPANICLSEEGKVKVLDFGLAKAAGGGDGEPGSGPTIRLQTDSFELTREGLVLGTPTYMSPEQARGKRVDRRTDIWSFGCVLFECLTGTKTFAGETTTDVLGAIVHKQPDWSLLPKGLPRRVRELLGRCLEKEARLRLRDVGEARIVLDRALRDLRAGVVDERPATAAPARGRGLGLLGALALAVLAAGAGWWAAGRGADEATFPEPVRQSHITFSGTDSEPAASPDGRLIAFVSRRDGTSRIWLKQLEGGGEAALTSGPDFEPCFSPDGGSILFTRQEPGGVVSLYRAPLVGGQARRLIEGGVEGTWSPDGQRIAFLRLAGERGERLAWVMVAQVDGSEPREVYRVADQNLYGLSWSPDGRRLAVVQAPPINAAACRVMLIDVRDGSATELGGVPGDMRPSSLAWTADGRRLVYARRPPLVAELPVAEVVAHDVESGAVQPLFWAQGLDSRIDLLGDGRLVYESLWFQSNLEQISLTEERGEQVALTGGNSVDRQPVFSPDGSTVLFSSSRSGNLDLWTVAVGDGAVLRLTEDAAADWDPAYTPDGRGVLWSSSRSGNLEVWMARADGSDARQVTHDGVDAENPTMTADGQWIVYSSTNPAHLGLHAIRPDGSDDRLLVPGSCFIPDVSPDGRWVAFLSTSFEASSNVLRVASVEDGSLTSFELTTALSGDDDEGSVGPNYGRSRWLPDGSGLVFALQDVDGRMRLYAQDFDPDGETGGSRRVLAEGKPGEAIETFCLSPDGRTAVISSLRFIGSVVLAEHVPGLDGPGR